MVRLGTLALALVCSCAALAAPALAEQASSEQRGFQAGLFDAGADHTCITLTDRGMRCWGAGEDGRLGTANVNDVGDNEAPAIAGSVFLDFSPTVRAFSAGVRHNCVIINAGNVRCWGGAAEGRLGYGNTNPIGDNEPPADVGFVDFGGGRTARAISAGGSHSCAILDDNSARCWGASIRHGYPGLGNIGDNETPAAVGPVDLGAGRTPRAISAGGAQSCALLDDGTVRCWGGAGDGQLGYGNTQTIGDNETPGSVGPVNLGGRTARAIAAGDLHTCAILDDGGVRCWGFNANGQLGQNTTTPRIGDDEPPPSGNVSLGAGRTARAIAVGGNHTCAILDNGSVRCWGRGFEGQLGYGNTNDIGDNETPASAGSVDLGTGHTARAITAGFAYTCVVLDDGGVKCWGRSNEGQLGYGFLGTVGDNESPGGFGPVDLGGLAFSSVADLSLSMSADRSSAQTGDQVVLRTTLTNSGPDAAGRTTVAAALPSGLSFASVDAGGGSYDAGSGSWAVPGVAAGASRTLELRATVTGAGTLNPHADVIAAGVPDPDSTPGNGATAEDDHAATTVVTTAAPGGSGDAPTPVARADTTPPGFSIARLASRMKRAALLKSGVSLRLTPDEPAAFRIELLGTLRGARVARPGDLILAERSLALGAGARSARLKLGRRQRRYIGRRARLTVRITATDAAGNRKVSTRRVTVR